MDRRELVNQCIDYIMQNLDTGLTLDNVANHFHFSKYYFSRVFKEETGESIYSFIKRCKVDQSAIDIKLKCDRTITDIGLDFGYSSSNYSSIFKKHHAISPVAFRKTTHDAPSVAVPFNPERTACFKTYQEYASEISIEELKSFHILYERYIGDYVDLAQYWYRFLDKHRALIDEKALLIERFFHDPSITNRGQCICDTCITVEQDCPFENVTNISGGIYAIYHYEGEIEDIFETLQGVFSVWLPHSGYKMKQRYGLNLYQQIGRENSCVSMDLCIPIK